MQNVDAATTEDAATPELRNNVKVHSRVRRMQLTEHVETPEYVVMPGGQSRQRTLRRPDNAVSGKIGDV